MDRHGLSLRWMAERMDTTHHTIGAWLAGDSRPRDRNAFNRMLEIITEFERTIRESNPGTIAVKRVGIRQIPIYSSISAGMPTGTTSDVELMDVMDWGTDRERWGRVIDGFSMSPLLEPGDVVIFESRQWEPGHVVHAYDDGEDCVKVARGHGPSVRLVPINPEYPVIDGKKFNIKGVAVERIRKGPADERTRTEYPHGMRSGVTGE